MSEESPVGKTLARRSEAVAEDLECADGTEEKRPPMPIVKYGRDHVQKLVKRVLLENAWRKGEWVEYQGRPITNLELIIRELLESRNWQAKIAAIELGFGKAPQIQQHEGGVEVVFRVEHDDKWIEDLGSTEDDEDDTVETTFEVIDEGT